MIAELNPLSPVVIGGGSSTKRDSMMNVFLCKDKITAEPSSGCRCTRSMIVKVGKKIIVRKMKHARDLVYYLVRDTRMVIML